MTGASRIPICVSGYVHKPIRSDHIYVFRLVLSIDIFPLSVGG
jgi:hypothetical protein